MVIQYKPLKELVKIVIDYRGKTPSKLGGEWGSTGYRALSALNVKTRGLVAEDKIRFVDKDLYRKWMKEEVKKGDILITSEAPFGQVLQWNSDEKIVLSQRLFALRIKPEYNSSYIYHYMASDFFYGELKARATGSTVEGLRQPALMKCKIGIPSWEVQCHIASILSAYDSQIENNQKRIKLLEQMAENLYKEWFVRFRFPGYENAEFEGGVPKGWKDLQAQDVFNITIGRTPSRKVFEFFSTERMNNCSWISISDMKNRMFIKDTSEYLAPEALKACNMPMVKANTVLLSFKLTVGKVAISLEETSTNEAIAHFNTDDKTLREYTYLYLKCFNYSKLGNTSAIGNAINSTIVKNMSFRLPSKDIVLEFHKQVNPLFEEIIKLTQQISSLTTQRDLLLPRLMSGKLSI